MSLSSQFNELWQFVWPRAVPINGADQLLVAKVFNRADLLQTKSDGELRHLTDELREHRRVSSGSAGQVRIVDCFSLVVEAIRRTLSITLYDVQILAGLTLARRGVAEMQTGEGKTFAAVLPAVWHALEGQGVHVATPNIYLAERDFQLLSPAYEKLGLRVGLLPATHDASAKRTAYAADITYGTGYEFGFDYLRDQLAAINQSRATLGQAYRQRLAGVVYDESTSLLQRGRAHAIIDEIDSVLIDEACTPLVLSNLPTCSHPNAGVYLEARKCATQLAENRDFVLDAKHRIVSLTPSGTRAIYQALAALPDRCLERPWSEYVEQALAAQWLRQRDVDYVVDSGRIRLVDEFTGRIFADRSWRNGLHQAVEAKEGLTITTELSAEASISRQKYFRCYRTMAGLTGTAYGSQREFWNTFRLPVTVIPPRTPSRANAIPTRFFATLESKCRAVIESIASMHRTGRPILVGSRTIENSQLLAQRLTAAGIPFRLLNGRQDQDEATVIAQAGVPGAVTIATNMAGRGTDIKLGAKVAALGGLHMIGLERHESERVDRQLAGRVARQGAPGSFQFFVSSEDPLLVRHDPGLAQQMCLLADHDGEIRRDFSAELERLQTRIEREQYRQRCQLMAHDRWLDELRDKLATIG